MSLAIRTAQKGEAGLALGFIRKLADYERRLDEVVASEAEIEEALFGPNPRTFCDVAEWNGEAVGFAIWFYNFSTFWGRNGIYLEDLFVEPRHRGRGIGKALLRHLARKCRDEGLPRLQWWVINWNEPSIAFYKSLGAVPMDEWTVYRLTGEPLKRLADS